MIVFNEMIHDILSLIVFWITCIILCCVNDTVVGGGKRN